MITQGIRNFFKDLKYVFIPLGTVALGFVFGLSVLLSGLESSLSALAVRVETILQGTEIDLTVLGNRLFESVRALDWKDPLAAIGTILKEEWLNATLSDCIAALSESADAYFVPIDAAIADFTAEVSAYVAVLVSFSLLGLIGGFFLVKWLVRKEVAQISLWKYILVSLIDALISAIIVAFFVWLFSFPLWQPFAWFSSAVMLLLFGGISLFEAYIVHGRKRVKIKEIVNGRNILSLVVSDLIIFLSAAVFSLIVGILINELVGLFLGIGLFVIACIVISLNAEAYVKSVVQKSKGICPPVFRSDEKR